MTGRGINLGGAFDRRDGRRGWEVRGEHLDAIAAAGFSHVRLPVRWAETPLEPVAAVIGAAWARGLAVVVTNHHDDETMADPAGARGRLTELWEQLATHFLDARGSLAFELLNEPRISVEAWNELLPPLVGAVRSIDAERPLVVGGVDMSSVGGLRGLELPDDEHLVATIHYYEPFAFTHQGADWEPGSEAWLGTRWGSDADRAAVTGDLEAAVAWAAGYGVPLYAGEFGALATADRESRVRWTRWVREQLDSLAIPWAYWDFATDFGAYDLERGAWREHLLGALIDGS
jgi:endoglucanase